MSNNQVPDLPQRRKFTAEYKLRILQEIDSRKGEERGIVGKILRRESLFAAQVASWRRSLEGVIANGLPERKRGRKPDPALAYKQEAGELERRLRKAEEELRRARLIIEAQKSILRAYPMPGEQLGDENL